MTRTRDDPIRIVSFAFPTADQHWSRMSWFLAILVVCILLGLVSILVVATSRHKKSATSDIQLIGSSGLVDSELAPQGTVLIRGELWSARSIDGARIPPQANVRVVELQGHVLVVEPNVRETFHH